MIATIAVVVTFVVLGISVVFVALGNGPRGAQANLPKRRSRGGTGVRIFGFTTLGLIGMVGLPVLLLSYNASDQSKAAPGGLTLTAAQQNGRELFAYNCATCHKLAASNSVGRVGPSLDAIIPPLPDKKQKVAYILDAIANGRARGMGQMPAELVDGQDAERVADFIAVTAGR